MGFTNEEYSERVLYKSHHRIDDVKCHKLREDDPHLLYTKQYKKLIFK